MRSASISSKVFPFYANLYSISLELGLGFWSNLGILFGVSEGVLYAKKDYNLEKHPLIDVPNLQVIKLMQSFKSREYVRETFAWMHYYWYLTNDGIEYLRTFLNLPSEIVPATLKKSTRAPSRPFGSGPPGDRPRYLLLSGCSLIFIFFGSYCYKNQCFIVFDISFLIHCDIL